MRPAVVKPMATKNSILEDIPRKFHKINNKYEKRTHVKRK
jgi:hypothetical protein